MARCRRKINCWSVRKFKGHNLDFRFLLLLLIADFVKSGHYKTALSGNQMVMEQLHTGNQMELFLIRSKNKVMRLGAYKKSVSYSAFEKPSVNKH